MYRLRRCRTARRNSPPRAADSGRHRHQRRQDPRATFGPGAQRTFPSTRETVGLHRHVLEAQFSGVELAVQRFSQYGSPRPPIRKHGLVTPLRPPMRPLAQQRRPPSAEANGPYQRLGDAPAASNLERRRYAGIQQPLATRSPPRRQRLGRSTGPPHRPAPCRDIEVGTDIIVLTWLNRSHRAVLDVKPVLDSEER